MKKIIITALCLIMGTVLAVQSLALSSPIKKVAKEDFGAGEYIYENGGRTTKLKYRVRFPSNYDGARQYPLILLLHGGGENGDDNALQISHVGLFFDSVNEKPYDAFLLVPQAPVGKIWNGDIADATLGLVKYFLNSQPVDRDRVYVTGYSNGGYGTWNLIYKEPGMFSAGIPMCGWFDTSKAAAFTEIPIYAFHGSDDDIISVYSSRDMIKSIIVAGGKKTMYTEFAGMGHGCWTYALGSGVLRDWLFFQTISERDKDRPKIIIEGGSAKPGETLTVTVKGTDKTDAEADLFFRDDIMSFASSSCESAKVKRDGVVSVLVPKSGSVTVSFLVDKDAEDGTYGISVVPQTEWEGEAIFGSECELDIYSTHPGDVNGNGTVDETDAVILGRWLAYWDIEVTDGGADANRDGFINETDSVLIGRRLAGWNVTLGILKANN